MASIPVDGGQIAYHYVDRPDSCLVVPRRRDSGNYVLLHCHRPTFPGEWTLEFPQGGIEPGESPAQAAGRELTEETGYRAVTLCCLGVLQEAAGFANSRIHVFVAEVRDAGAATPEPLEAGNEVRELADAELREAVARGRIADAATLAALALHDRVP